MNSNNPSSNLPRILVSPDNIYRGRFVSTDIDIVNKLRKVLRLAKGDFVRIFDGEGKEFVAQITLLRRDCVKGKIQEVDSERLKLNLQNSGIILAQALTQSNKIDQIIRMNTEISVDKFIFFESDHSIVKLKDFHEEKIDRWMKLAGEASRQSERTILPDIDHPVDFEEICKVEADLKILPHSKSVDGIVDLSTLKQEIRSAKTILVVIGPEGGFSDREIEFAKAKNLSLVHLNLPILRTETAGAVVSGYLAIERGS